MPDFKLSRAEAAAALKALGYGGGRSFPQAVGLFQVDCGLSSKNYGDKSIYGVKTDAALAARILTMRTDGPAAATELRRWDLTWYYVGEQSRWVGGAPASIPVMTPQGELLATYEPRAFVEAALEGQSKTVDGRLLNVANPPYRDQPASVLQPVYDIAKRNGWIPSKAGYAGLRLGADGQPNGARCFSVVPTGPDGYSSLRGIPMQPFRTLAADIGLLKKHDPKWKGKGGVCPPKTRVWILEFAGKKLPDGSIHDGWFTVNDTGGGIFGAHYDVFTGTYRLGRQVFIPPRAHVWFEGIETKLPATYTYGLK